MRTYTEYDLVQDLCDPKTADRAASYLYERYFGSIYSLARKMGGTSEDAEDVFQEVVIAFIDKVGKKGYNPYGEASILTYLNRMAYFILNKRLVRKPQQAGWEKEFADRYLKAGNTEQEYNNRMTAIALLESLGPRCKELLTAFYIEGIDLNDLSEMHGMSPGTIGQRIRRCVGKLKSYLEKWKSKN